MMEFDSVFTEVSPSVFVVDPEYWGMVDGKYSRFSVADSDSNRPMAGDGFAAVFLDGGVITREEVDPEMYANDSLGDGIWVVGRNAVRLICDAAGIGQPKWAKDSNVSLESIHAEASARRVVSDTAEKQLKDLSYCDTAEALAAFAIEMDVQRR